MSSYTKLPPMSPATRDFVRKSDCVMKDLRDRLSADAKRTPFAGYPVPTRATTRKSTSEENRKLEKRKRQRNAAPKDKGAEKKKQGAPEG